MSADTFMILGTIWIVYGELMDEDWKKMLFKLAGLGLVIGGYLRF